MIVIQRKFICARCTSVPGCRLASKHSLQLSWSAVTTTIRWEECPLGTWTSMTYKSCCRVDIKYFGNFLADSGTKPHRSSSGLRFKATWAWPQKWSIIVRAALKLSTDNWRGSPYWSLDIERCCIDMVFEHGLSIQAIMAVNVVTDSISCHCAA